MAAKTVLSKVPFNLGLLKPVFEAQANLNKQKSSALFTGFTHGKMSCTCYNQCISPTGIFHFALIKREQQTCLKACDTTRAKQ